MPLIPLGTWGQGCRDRHQLLLQLHPFLHSSGQCQLLGHRGCWLLCCFGVPAAGVSGASRVLAAACLVLGAGTHCSPAFPSPTVHLWGTEEVAAWLEHLSLCEYKDIFTRHDIRGSELLHLERRDLKVLPHLGLPAAPSVPSL